MKQNVNSNIKIFKIKRIIKCYLQEFEVNFNQIFIKIVKLMAFQVLFAIVIYYNLYINQINIKITFLYDFIELFINVKMPKI